MLLLVTNRKVHNALRLVPRSMTLNSISLNFQRISLDFADFGRNNRGKRMNIDQYCQRERCKHVEYEQLLACFRVARVCQRQLGFLVFLF